MSARVAMDYAGDRSRLGLPHRSLRVPSRRTAACLAFIVLSAVFTVILAVEVPVKMSWLPWSEATRHWGMAAVCATLLVAGAITVVIIALSRRGSVRTRRSPALYGFFLAVTVLQIGHLGEHTVQVTQLLLTNGDLARSHGAFGQLDFETVHFVWDSLVWLTLAVLLCTFPRNGWLWFAFVVASVHEVEHLYLYWIYLADKDFYMRGGLAGIFGLGGVVGSPLVRPYLHFMYNVLVVIPTLLAFRHQTAQTRAERRRLYDRLLALPLAATSGEAVLALRRQLDHVPVRYL